MTDLFRDHKRSVLIVDDEPGMRSALQANFLRHGWNVKTASGVREALFAIDRTSYDLVVSDIRMRDGDGFEVLNLVRKDSPSTAVILLTAFGTVPEAVKSMRDGAFDYLTKPVSFDQLQATATRVMLRASEERFLADPAAGPESSQINNVGTASPCMIGRSPLLLQTLQRARAVASTNADVLIEAESGTGKNLLARFIHESSDRSNEPFVVVNCAAVPEHLMESELFGYENRSIDSKNTTSLGKLELANGGTLLLDRIGEMPLRLQPKLLRALQERAFDRLGEPMAVSVNIRVIAITDGSLGKKAERGSFRTDLYHRLNIIPLSIPALRERPEDIPTLALHFARQVSAEVGCAVPDVESSFLHALRTHTWPGNIHELANFMRRVLSLHQGGAIDAQVFHSEMKLTTKVHAPLFTMPAAGTKISDLEKAHLENTLALARGNRTHAAEMLGISLRTVRNKIKEYGLPPRRYA